jgi:hypothetical protein
MVYGLLRRWPGLTHVDHTVACCTDGLIGEGGREGDGGRKGDGGRAGRGEGRDGAGGGGSGGGGMEGVRARYKGEEGVE